MKSKSIDTNTLKNQQLPFSKIGVLTEKQVSGLINIPILLPGETLASYALRAQLMNVFSNSKLASKGLFGTSSTKWSANFFGNLDHLGQVTNIDQNTLIRHTLLPIYQPFYSDESYTQAQQILSANWLGGLSRLLGNIYSRMQQPAICPKCISEDLAYHGFAYWRICHQLALVECCPKHQTLLLTHCTTCNTPLVDPNNRTLPNLECPHCKQALPVIQLSDSDEREAFLIRLVKFVDDAFLGQIPFVNERVRWAIYQRQAQKLKIHFRNNLWWKLSQLLEDKYGSDRLERLELSLVSGKTRGWLGLANLGIAYSNDPTVNLLMLSLLFQSTADYVAAIDQFDAPEEGQSNEGLLFLKKGNGISFGLLRSLIASKKNLKRISHQYPIDVDILSLLIKKHPKLSAAKKRYRKITLIHQHRKKITLLYEQGRIKAVDDLKYVNSKIYSWTLHHDSDWIKMFIETHNLGDKNNINQVDKLDLIDQQLTKAVNKICEAELQKTESLRLISKIRFLEQFGYRNKRDLKIGRLPKTQQAIESHVEDYRAFVLRKLLTAILTLMKEGNPITKEIICQKATLSPRNVKALNQLIEDILKFLR